MEPPSYVDLVASVTMSNSNDTAKWRGYLSPLSTGLMVVNGMCFGGSLVLLAVGKGPVLLTISKGLMLPWGRERGAGGGEEAEGRRVGGEF